MPVERFEVLQRSCKNSQARGGASLDILLTRYCSINSKGEMLALAQRMSKLPPLGVITFEANLPEQK